MHDNEIIITYAHRLFKDTADIQDVVNAKNDAWKAKLWNGIEEIGLNLAAVPEEQGGAGIGLQGSFEILRAAGNMALSCPLAETILAGWLLGIAGIPVPSGKIALAPSGFSDNLHLENNLLTGRIARLPFGRDCAHVALLLQAQEGMCIALANLGDAEFREKYNIAYEPTDEVIFSQHKIITKKLAPAGITQESVLLMGSLARSMQMAGALEKILLLCMEYASQRKAFEKTISKFQAVQHNIAQLAGEVAISLSTAASAAEAVHTLVGQGKRFDDPQILLEIISAKSRIASAAQKGAAIAHQLHGAIGVTQEHILHRLTLRLLAWRDEYGNESDWSGKLGQMICNQGPSQLWPLLSSR